MSTDEGGEAPCFAHLLDEPLALDDALRAGLVRGLADAVIVADAEGTIVFWNDAASRVFNWPAEQAVGQSLDLIIPALHRDGRRLSIAFTVTLLRRAGQGQPFAIAAVVRDDTARWQERRRLQEELAARRS